ncbi:TPA: hypothetical protein L3V69_001426 [Vibrio parahaemolyticus]|uniref:hypothetical protein n=1 Tax=Vibrio parahaemolyticus TaxID=670 RepID=UPI0002E9A33B|nr:hypothetical protein [Vibrio parahaemolyticus]EGR3399541.1 hypothetical protein [Vibrio parahaemolyticus]EJA7341277.1 hypothetical protein [Vibrio parahaemolyticus]KYY79869.1 hypothetical protein AW029_02420 [Vibrio parahaemolyticus]MBY3750852.1 hypothetical protein [Vibrio parahaemolyticus]MBY3757855.1 hypothetical protein [Vibrio parahaemolyticus]
MNKILAGLAIILMPLAISNISFSNNYGELNSTLEILVESSNVMLTDIESIKVTTKHNGERIEAIERMLIE